MMRRTAELPYVPGTGFQEVLLPYQASRLAMAVVLPGGQLADLAPLLAGRGMAGLLEGATRRRVALALPRFRPGHPLAMVARNFDHQCSSRCCAGSPATGKQGRHHGSARRHQ
jgi:hypothetical protein